MSSIVIDRRGAAFNGTSTALSLGSAQELGILDHDFTVEAWVMLTGSGSTRYPIVGSLENQSRAGLHLCVDTRKVYMGFFGSDTRGTTELALNTWYHLSFRYTKQTNEQALFINGVRDAASLTNSSGSLQGTGEVFIGRCFGSSFFPGRIDEVRVWNHARSENEILGDKDRRLGGSEPGLTSYTILDDSTFSTSAPPYVDNGAMSLDGSSYLPLAPARDLGLLDGDFTVEAWINVRDLGAISGGGTEPTILGSDLFADAYTRRGLHLILRAGKVHMGFYSEDLSGTTTLSENTWYHVAFRYTLAAQQQAIFINGVQDSVSTTPKGRLQQTGLISIGRSFGQNYFKGMISDLRIWKCARAEQDIRDGMSQRLLGNEPNLAGYWKLADRGTLRDETRGGHHAIPQGNVQFALSRLPLRDWCCGVGTVTHEGKVLIFGTARDGSIRYTVKQSGFEDSALLGDTALPGWEDWATLELPNEDDDTSVTQKEAAELTWQSDATKFILRSRYKSAALGAATPVQVVSGLGHLYVFRQSTAGTLLCDRFVLDGLENKLIRKLEVRFKKSKKRHEPYAPPNAAPSTDQQFDSLDFSDNSDPPVPFYEPTTELCMVDKLQSGWFSVVLVPTTDVDRMRWHFFSYNGDKKAIELVSIRSSEDGLFDVKDCRSSIPPLPRIPGILRRTFDLSCGTVAARVTGGISATRYDLQQEILLDSGQRQLVRTSTRLMLAVPTQLGTAALSFGISIDGILSELKSELDSRTVLRAQEREILLPLTSLDEIRPIGATPVLSGAVSGVERAAQDNVRVGASNHSELTIGDAVAISGIASYNRSASITRIDENTFEIAASFEGEGIGTWQRVRPETGIYYDGAVLGYSRTPSGALRVSAVNHGLESGDAVQLVGTSSYEGTYGVTAVGSNYFEIDAHWQLGEAVNVKLQSLKRRGLTFDWTRHQYVEVPSAAVPTGTSSLTLEAWIKPYWMGILGIVGWGFGSEGRQVELRLSGSGLRFMWSWGTGRDVETGDLTNSWHHVALTYDAATQTSRIYVDGVLTGGSFVHPSGLALSTGPVPLRIGATNGLQEFFAGAIAEVRVWSAARSASEIRSAMYQRLNGNEADLCGYWPLGAVIEGTTRTVVDFSTHRKDGVVERGALVSLMQLPRRPSGWQQDAVRYRNEDLIAVTQGMTYEESFEYSLEGGDAGGAPLPFSFSYWGRKSRDSTDVIPIPAELVVQLPAESIADEQGWQRARCVFTVPDGISLVRVFDVNSPTGGWTNMTVRRHRLKEQPAAISETIARMTVSPEVIADDQGDLATSLRIMRSLELREGTLLKRAMSLQVQIKAAEDNQASQKSTEARTLRDQYDTQLTKQQSTYNAMFAEKYQFYCRFVARHSGKALDVQDQSTQNAKLIHQWDKHTDWDSQLFCCIPVTGTAHWKIKSKLSGKYFDIEGASQANNARIQQYDANDGQHQQFAISRIGTSDYYSIKARHSGKALDIWDGSQDNGAELIQFDAHGYDNQQFEIILVQQSETTQAILNDIIRFSSLRDAADRDYRYWDAIARDAAAKLAQWRAELIEVNGQLAAVRTKLTPLGPQLLGIIAAQRSTTARMVTLATDSVGLVTRGSFLRGVQPAGAVFASEGCEGNVELSYIDSDGCLRVTRYDATADTRDVTATYEQWLPDRLRSCLRLSAPGSVAALSAPIPLKNEWTFEAWFFYPLPVTTTGYNVLCGGTTEWHVAVRDNRLGGLTTDTIPTNPFLDCGFDMSTLAVGWHHVAAVARGSVQNSTTSYYIDGLPVGDAKSYGLVAQRIKVATTPTTAEQDKLTAMLGRPFKITTNVSYIGNSAAGSAQAGLLAEVRIFDTALTDTELLAHSKLTLTGNEPQLLAYFPCSDAQGGEIRDYSGSGRRGVLQSAGFYPCCATVSDLGSPASAAVTTEYSTVLIEPETGKRLAMMRKGAVLQTTSGLRRFADKRIETLELLWLGNAQYAPTLLGYIEGAPPVPSENLTQQDSYDGATSVSLTKSDSVSYSWSRSRDESSGVTVDGFVGTDNESETGLSVMGLTITQKSAAWRLGIAFDHTAKEAKSRGTTIGAESSSEMTDQLKLRGSREQQPKFPYLGRRYVPKNIGYALVISGVADVYATRLTRSQKMVGYEVLPNKDIPFDVNTITFLINPAYTMNGSLDGLTGSAATSSRFFRHVPQMRAQYGSQYPASYYRVKEAYEIKRTIENLDKKREAYFRNFNAAIRLTDSEDKMDSAINKGDEPGPVGVGSSTSTATPTSGKTQEQLDKEQAAADTERKRQQSEVEQRKQQIEQRFSDPDEVASAKRDLDDWQKKMETLLVRAGKRNIVNTYVWDSDGGLHSEQQQFASTIEHSVGSSISKDASVGVDSKFLVAGWGFELKAKDLKGMSQTFTKTTSSSRGFGLSVDLSGVEGGAVTDYKNRPLSPGEKVSRYRFMSFYLENSTQNFNDFWNYVIDPEWLAGNSESARALRQVDRSKKNPAWRVLHRVTYVERPALMGFGTEQRPVLAPEGSGATLTDKVNQLAQDTTVKDKVNQILEIVKAIKAQT